MNGACRMSIATACALWLVCAVAPSRAQVASVPPILAGSWAHDGDVARGMHTVQRAFAPGIDALPFFLQSLARNRIEDTLQPARTIEVTLTGPRVRVVLHENVLKTIDGALDAHATTSGVQDDTTVTPRISSGWLDLVYEGEGSSMHQLFSTEPDGAHMHVDYTIVNPRLGTVRYRLEYVRAPS